MNFVNLTPHTINEVTTGQSFAPSGIVARVATRKSKLYEHAGIPVYKTELGVVEGLPDPVKDTIYIVSALTLNKCGSRSDVVSPGNLQRDEKGQPIGCLGFTQ